MKTKLVVLVLLFVINGTMAQRLSRFQNSQTVDSFFSLKSARKHPLVLAHRGGPGPSDTENSIVTFTKTAQKLPDVIIEMDVRMTADSNFVLLHDATLDRESDGKGAVAERTLTELANVKLKTLSGALTEQSIPTFTDILLWNRNRYMLALDVKPGTDPLRVMNEVAKHRAVHSVFVICYSMAEAQRVRAQYPTLWLAVGVNNMADLNRFETSQLVSGQRLIALTPQKLQPVLFYERLHKLGVLASVGTYGTEQLDEKPMTEAAGGYREIVRQGGDIITTDRPIDVSVLF
ncbi:glycerophosphodiester phosphodiesterase family protein [Spirosoma linguale]|uniref:Glycerophosphoryl diester phosphodiesterase n=1 Tax=Spirosoma linguale (strain ATCC 33905 / DSM 74 / LMG 10896 / Claus 1) TaxID=504472 RepID=D2QKJ4_SPILD|nr:glycerophosphoryl diester phosphodiesterase [Spirosoma linguale DSM 74]